VDGFISSDLKAITVDQFVTSVVQGATGSLWPTSWPMRFFTGASTRHTDSVGSRTGSSSSFRWTRRIDAGWSGRRTPLPV
jgi:hypothetical protein